MAESEDMSGHDARVQFSEDTTPEPKSRRKVELTQRYDRREVQKRLDIENWMDEQMKGLYECEVSSISQDRPLRVCIRVKVYAAWVCLESLQ